MTVEGGTGEATATVVFSEPGEYVLRARVDNWDANDSTGGDQCCWTNAYVRVTVNPLTHDHVVTCLQVRTC